VHGGQREVKKRRVEKTEGKCEVKKIRGKMLRVLRNSDL
jgi:hypothetical protein